MRPKLPRPILCPAFLALLALLGGWTLPDGLWAASAAIINSYFGNQSVADSVPIQVDLNNNQRVSFSFYQSTTDAVDSIWIHGTSFGSAPSYYGSICADDGAGLPNLAIGCGGDYGGAPSTGWYEIGFLGSAPVTAGNVYHAVINYYGDGDPANYFRLDAYTTPAHWFLPYNQRFDSYMNTTVDDGTGSGFASVSAMPVFALVFASGVTLGIPYTSIHQNQVWGNTVVGESFAGPSSPYWFNQMGAYLKRVGSPSGPLTYLLEDLTVPTTLSTGPLATNTTAALANSWIDVVMPGGPFQLQPTHQYRVRFSSAGSSSSAYYVINEPYNSGPQTILDGTNYDSTNSYEVVSANGGGTWTSDTSADIGFRLTLSSAPTATFTPTKTPTATFTPTWTRTPTPTATRTSTSTFTPTITPSFTASFTPTYTATASQSFTPSFTATATPSPSFTPTSTTTFTITPTMTWTQTATAINTFTPNPALTPLCAPLNGVFGNTSTGTTDSGASDNTIWATKYNLTEAATITSMAVYEHYQNPNNPLIEAAIYSDTAGTPGNMIVSSPSQTLFYGWNYLMVPATVLSPGTYWLSYQAISGSGYLDRRSTYPTSNDTVYAYIPYGAFPGTYPSGYTSAEQLCLYAVYCPVTPYTPVVTPSDTPTSTLTSTVTFTPTFTPTFTATLTPTPSPSMTSTFTAPPTATSTSTWTATLSYTPSWTPTPTPSETPTPTVTNTSTITYTPGVCGSTPKLDLKIRKLNCSTSQWDWGFQVFNYDSQPVTLSDLEIRLWVNDSAPAIVASSFNSGTMYDGSDVLQFAVNSTGAAGIAVGPCVLPVTRQANWQLALAGQGGQAIPANGGKWVDATLSLNRTDYSAISSEADDFSQMPVGQPGGCSSVGWPTVYQDDPYYALYYKGTLVAEWTSSTAPDPNTGTQPACLPLGCVPPTATASFTPSFTATSTPSWTPSSTATLTPTSTSTWTPTATPSATATPSPTHTPTHTPTMTSTSTDTPTFTVSITATFTPSATLSFTPTLTTTFTQTSTATDTPTETPTATDSLSPTGSATATPIPTDSPTPTDSFTFTPSWTTSPTVTMTFTWTMTSTPTRTPTVTPTWTLTATWTPTPPPTNTPPPTRTPTTTRTPQTSLTLDTNRFDPRQGPLGMDVRIFTPGICHLRVYNEAGAQVAAGEANYASPGNYRIQWTGTNRIGQVVGNGLYLIVIETPSGRQVKKVIVLK